jgi:hypothetical protein
MLIFSPCNFPFLSPSPLPPLFILFYHHSSLSLILSPSSPLSPSPLLPPPQTLELCRGDQLTLVQDDLFKLLADCLASPHFQVRQRGRGEIRIERRERNRAGNKNNTHEVDTQIQLSAHDTYLLIPHYLSPSSLSTPSTPSSPLPLPSFLTPSPFSRWRSVPCTSGIPSTCA